MKKYILITGLLIVTIFCYSQSIESTVYLHAKCLTDFNIGIDKQIGKINLGLAYEHFGKLNLDAIYCRLYAKTYQFENYTNFIGFDAGICNNDLLFSAFTKQKIDIVNKISLIFYEKYLSNKFGEGFEFRIGFQYTL